MIFCIDLDGTLAEWTPVPENFEQGDEPFQHAMAVGDWMPGAERAVRRLRGGGHRVIIHTCRATWSHGGGVPAIASFLRLGGFMPFAVPTDLDWVYVYPDGELKENRESVEFVCQDPRAVGIWIGQGKPIAHAYLDDRGWQFSPQVGWDVLMDQLEQVGLLLAA